MEQDARRLLARELHDTVAQTLTGMLVDVENFKSAPVDWENVLRQLDMVQNSTRQVLASLRQLLHDLRSDDAAAGPSFTEALGALIARFEEKTQVTAELEVKPNWPELLTPAASLNLYRIIEEALSNVRMHSGARSVHIELECLADGELSLAVRDDGRGLDTHPSRLLGLGTIGMKERALFLGGELRIESQPGLGTTVVAVFPKQHLIPMESSQSLMAAKAVSA